MFPPLMLPAADIILLTFIFPPLTLPLVLIWPVGLVWKTFPVVLILPAMKLPVAEINPPVSKFPPVMFALTDTVVPV